MACCIDSQRRYFRRVESLELMRQGSTAVTPQKHYTKRAELTIQQLKVTLLVDTKVNAILDLHVTTTRKHDSQIAPSLIKRTPRPSTFCSVTKATTTRRSDDLPVTTRFGH